MCHCQSCHLQRLEPAAPKTLGNSTLRLGRALKVEEASDSELFCLLLQITHFQLALEKWTGKQRAPGRRCAQKQLQGGHGQCPAPRARPHFDRCPPGLPVDDDKQSRLEEGHRCLFQAALQRLDAAHGAVRHHSHACCSFHKWHIRLKR